MNDKIPQTIRHVLRAAPAAALATGIVCPAALGDPGDLDPTFADVGRFVVAPPDDREGRAQSIVVQDDDYIFAGGELVYDFYYDFSTLGFADRLSVDGTLDAGFDAPDLANTLVIDTAKQHDDKSSASVAGAMSTSCSGCNAMERSMRGSEWTASAN